jgi:hypothetical protein
MMETIHVQCRCGKIALEISGEPVVQLYCHCDDCRAAHAAAYVASAIYPEPAVRVVRGEPTPIVVKETPRMRCISCGTHLFSDITRMGLRSVNAFLLPQGKFQPQMHIQCQHAVVPVADDLPHYKGFPPLAGGTDERVGW